MSILNKIRERSEVDFSIVSLEIEAEQLRREHRHLKTKALERRLTLWEAKRLDLIVDELTEAISQIAELAK